MRLLFVSKLMKSRHVLEVMRAKMRHSNDSSLLFQHQGDQEAHRVLLHYKWHCIIKAHTVGLNKRSIKLQEKKHKQTGSVLADLHESFSYFTALT